jgi:hypothetical protein
MMQATILPVERIVSLSELVAGKVRHEQGSYNMGLIYHDGTYYGVFRNCTRNARHLLGWPAMAEGKYESTLYDLRMNAAFNLTSLREMKCDHVIHDVRLSKHGMIGCERTVDGSFLPVEIVNRPSGALWVQTLRPDGGKNWNHLPGGFFDVGWERGALRRRRGMLDYPVRGTGPELRGSAPYFEIGGTLYTTYHTVIVDSAGHRSYFHHFAQLTSQPPFALVKLSPPFKFERGGDAGRIQFLMACFPDPKDAKQFIVSYGEADADNCVAKIRVADVMGLLA